jgi:hypothetical protein
MPPADNDGAVAEDPAPVYRASKVSRGAAWFVLAAATVTAAWAIFYGGPEARPALVAMGVFSLLATAALRLEVRARPEHLVVCWGVGAQRIPWSDVRGFSIDERTEREVYVLLPDGRRLLPVVEVATRRTPASAVRDALQAYWRHHRRRQ